MYAPPCSCRTGTNSMEDSAKDSFRSKVSSPGMPNTCFTPSASKHSTKRSDALRNAMVHRLFQRPVATVPRPMKKLALLTSLALLALAGPASAASRSSFTIRGAGYGHGIGLSQYGAYGYAAHGADWKSIVLHYFKGTHLGNAAGRTIRVLLQSGHGTVWVSGATRAGSHKLDSTKSYRLMKKGIDSIELRTSGGKRIATLSGVVTVSSSSGSFALGGRALNGLSDGRYRGVLEVRPGTFGGLMAVNALPLDSYIQGVIVGEMPTSWPQPALEAQAVAARSYALTSDAGGTIFDQYPDTRSQMYYGMSRETPGTNQAVQATAGQVV